MNRLTVIQKIIDGIEAKSYLEIGVANGQVLFNVKTPIKYGIDPKFMFNIDEKLYENKALLSTNFYEMTSDKFFNEYADKELIKGVDVIFIDGLHTYNQSLKDVVNSLKFLNPNGVIIMHDCNPLSPATAYPVIDSINEVLEIAFRGDLPGWNGCWNGDVWKTLVHLRAEHENLEIFTLDLDWGLGIIYRRESSRLTAIKIEDLKNVDYSFLDNDRVNLLNLKPPKYIDEFLKTIHHI